MGPKPGRGSVRGPGASRGRWGRCGRENGRGRSCVRACGRGHLGVRQGRSRARSALHSDHEVLGSGSKAVLALRAGRPGPREMFTAVHKGKSMSHHVSTAGRQQREVPASTRWPWYPRGKMLRATLPSGAAKPDAADTRAVVQCRPWPRTQARTRTGLAAAALPRGSWWTFRPPLEFPSFLLKLKGIIPKGREGEEVGGTRQPPGALGSSPGCPPPTHLRGAP